jgi:hypothetical protein
MPVFWGLLLYAALLLLLLLLLLLIPRDSSSICCILSSGFHACTSACSTLSACCTRPSVASIHPTAVTAAPITVAGLQPLIQQHTAELRVGWRRLPKPILLRLLVLMQLLLLKLLLLLACRPALKQLLRLWPLLAAAAAASLALLLWHLSHEVREGSVEQQLQHITPHQQLLKQLIPAALVKLSALMTIQ